MTCVLPTTPWNHFNDHIPWFSMNPDSKSSQLPLDKSLSQRYVSPGSDTRKSSSSSGKKRASRAGTRSVSTLSAAQLERKRANDREAQRAIRQRTKDHIDHLERSINELRGSQEASEKLVHVTQQRNRELEDEIAYLRGKLGEAGYSIDHRGSDQSLLSVPSTSPVHSSRAGSLSNPSSHSMPAQTSRSRHGSWQHPTATFPGATNTGMTLPSSTGVSNAPSLTTWRSHDNLQSGAVLGPGLPDPIQTPGAAYHHHDQRVDWQVNPTSYPPYGTQEQPRPELYETAPAQQQHGFQQPPVQPYGASPSPQPPGYHTQLNGQADFAGIPVSSGPSSYQPAGNATFPQAAAPFQVTPVQIPSSGGKYTASPTSQMQPPPLPGTSTYGAQPAQSPLYGDDGSSRTYSLTQFGTA